MKLLERTDLSHKFPNHHDTYVALLAAEQLTPKTLPAGVDGLRAFLEIQGPLKPVADKAGELHKARLNPIETARYIALGQEALGGVLQIAAQYGLQYEDSYGFAEMKSPHARFGTPGVDQCSFARTTLSVVRMDDTDTSKLDLSALLDHEPGGTWVQQFGLEISTGIEPDGAQVVAHYESGYDWGRQVSQQRQADERQEVWRGPHVNGRDLYDMYRLVEGLETVQRGLHLPV